MATFADLERLTGEPEFAPLVVDWGALGRALSFSFPDDYKRFFEKYHLVQFDRFLTVYHPGDDIAGYVSASHVAVRALRIVSEQGGMTLVDDAGEEGERVRYPIFPDEGGLFHWGTTENGDSCLWLTGGDDPNAWPIFVSDSSEIWRYDGTFVDFLVGVMDRTVRCPLFPASFPSSLRVDQFDARRLSN